MKKIGFKPRAVVPEDAPGEGVDPQSGDSTLEAPGQLSFPDQAQATEQADRQLDFPDKPSALEGVYGSVSKLDPARASRVIDLAKRFNQPEAFIDKNLPDAEHAAKQLPPSLFPDLEAKSPEVAKWLKDRRNMAVAHDDIPNLAKHEELAKGIAESRGLTDAIKIGWQHSALGLKALGHAPDGDLPQDASTLERNAAAAAGIAGDLPSMIMGGIAGGETGATVGATVGGLAGSVVPGVGTIAGVGVGGLVGGVLGGGAGAMAAPAIIKKMLMLKYEQGDVKGFKDLLDRSSQILAAGVTPATLGALTSVVGPVVGKFAGAGAEMLAGPTAAKIASPLASIAAEVGTFTEVGNAMEGKETTANDWLDNLIQVGAMHLSTHAAQASMSHYVDMKRTEAAKNFYISLGDTAEGSKLRERMPDAHRALVGEITKDGPVSDVYIPREALHTYFQSKGVDGAKIAEQMGVAESYREAMETGGDVRIPLPDWVENVVGTEHHAALADDIKFDPDDLTANQAKEHQADIEKGMADLEARAKESGAVVSGDEIKTKVFNHLKELGYSNKEAAANAMLLQKHYEVRAERRGLGESAQDLFERDAPLIGDGTAQPERLAEPPAAAKHQEGKKLTDNQKAMLEDLHDSMLENQARGEYFQSDLNQPGDTARVNAAMAEKPRGRISFDKNRLAVIDLFQNKDASTLIHELSHKYLEEMIDDATTAGVDPQLPKDLDTILGWMGLNSKSAHGPEAIRAEMQADHHEQFARGNEAYLMEGNSPSDQLRKVFRQFSKWLTKIYGSIKNLNINLNGDVREVLDRMYASNAEIEKAAQTIGYQAELAKTLPPEVAKRLGSLQEQAKSFAVETLMREQMKELTSQRKEFLASARAEITTHAEADVQKMPIFQAMGELAHDVGQNKVKGMAEKLVKGTLDATAESKFEALAEVHGFADGADLAKQILDAKENGLFDKEVKVRVDEGMNKYADLKDTDKIKAEAMKAIHSDKSTELLALEHHALLDLINNAEIRTEVVKRKRVEARVEAEAAKDQAKRIMDAKPIKDAAQARTYITGERKAAISVDRALAAKDFEAAAEHKRQQMLNHALAAEAMRNKAEADKALGYLDKQAKRGRDLKDMPYGFNRQVDQLLSKNGLADSRPEDSATLSKIAQQMFDKKEDLSAIANATGLKQNPDGTWAPENLNDFVSRVNQEYRGLTLPDSVMNGQGKPYENLTMQELRDLRDTVKTVTKIGKTFDRFLESYRTMDIRTAAAAFKKAVEENFGTPEKANLAAGSQHSTRLQEIMATVASIPGKIERVLDTMATLAEKFDGRKEGPAKDNIVRPLAEAQNREQARMTKMMEEVDGIFAKHFDQKEFSKYKDIRIQFEGRTFTKHEILCMALNFGNEHGRDRLLRGSGLDDAKLKELFKNLGKNDWDFAQATWDHLNSAYWADAAKLEMDANGVEPKKVDPQAFDNEHGHYSGGYYPLGYDYDKSTDALQNSQAKTALFQATSTAKAMTDQGAFQSRVKSLARPLRLDLDVLTNHHENMIHDLEFRRAIIDVGRFLYSRDAKEAITNAVGVRGFKAIDDWLKSAASNPSEPMAPGEAAARWFRFKTTFYNLGYKITSAPKIAIENVVNVSSEIGISGAARAVKEYYFGESGQHDLVMGKSEFMKQRANHLDRDLADLSKTWQGSNQSNYQRFAFYVHAFLDHGMSMPLWADVYKRALGEHGDEKLAITQADESIKRTFMTGGGIDQAPIMRGSEKQKALTTAFGYTSMMWNRFSLQKYDVSQALRQGRGLDAAAIGARAFIYTFAMPALVGAVTRELLRNGPTGNSDDRAKRMAATAIEEGTPLKFLPVVRDLAPYLIKKSLGEKGRDLQVSPLEGAAQTLMDPMAEVFHAAFSHDHRLGPQFPEHVAHAVSLVTGFPKQGNDIVFNFLDWQKDHGALTWRDAISRRQKH